LSGDLCKWLHSFNNTTYRCVPPEIHHFPVFWQKKTKSAAINGELARPGKRNPGVRHGNQLY